MPFHEGMPSSEYILSTCFFENSFNFFMPFHEGMPSQLSWGEEGSDKFPISQFRPPARPDFRSFGKRSSTFSTWPCLQKGEEMAKAGFYYTDFLYLKIVSISKMNF